MTKLCPRGKAAAKRKFAVYPSAYANAYASKICAGKIKDPSGKKRKDFKGPKPAGAQDGVFVERPKQPRRTKGKGPQRLSTEYIKKKRAYDDLVGSDRKRRKMSDPRIKKTPSNFNQGGMARGGGAAIKGTSFKGVF